MIPNSEPTTEVAAPPPDQETAPPGNGLAEGLEQRLRRLEEAVAQLQDTRELEERLWERMSGRAAENQPASLRESATQVMVEAGRRLLPAAVEMMSQPAVSPPVATPMSQPPVLPRYNWLVWDMYKEVQDTIRMFLDSRYQVSWTARLVPFTALILMLLSGFLPTNNIPIIGMLLEKVLDLVLAFMAYKALSREVHRYREALCYLPATRVR